MVSLPVLLLSVARVLLQPILIGSAAMVLAVARELTPRWPSDLRWRIYDGVLAGLVFLLFVYLVLRLQTL